MCQQLLDTAPCSREAAKGNVNRTRGFSRARDRDSFSFGEALFMVMAVFALALCGMLLLAHSPRDKSACGC